MSLEALQERLRASHGLDVDALVADWRSETGLQEVDEDAWLTWLLRIGAIDALGFVAAHATEPVHTLAFDTFFDPEDGGAPEVPAPVQPKGPRYVPLGTVGRGGMASILVARDAELGRKVAYKVLSDDAARRSVLVARFFTEVQVTAQLEHPNIVPIYGLVSGEGRPTAYAMKLVHGETLGELCARSAAQRAAGGRVDEDLQLDALLECFLKVCDAVDYAHGKGVVHRDLKPANIMVGRHGEVYVMDWGIAKVLGDPTSLDITRVEVGGDVGGAGQTRMGTVLGTPAYMSPEQARGENSRVGPHSDVYALGLVLYELVCGRPARTGKVEEVLALAAKGACAPIRAPDGSRPPRELDAILRKVLSTDGRKRYPTVDALADDLRRFRADEEVSAAPDDAVQRAQRWLSRHRRLTSALLVGLVLSSLLVVSAAVVGVVWKASRDSVAAHTREVHLTRLLARVNRLAGDVDQHFSSVEARVEAVAAGSRALLLYGQPQPEPWYSSGDDFEDVGTGPPDVAFSPVYGGMLSTRFPDVSVAAGADPEAADRVIRTVSPIRHELRRAHLSLWTRAGVSDEAEADAAWRSRHGPLRWASLGLREGVLIEMPGMKWDPEGYDPRVRPWYTLGVGATSPRWGHPYQESGMTALQMPCSVGVFDDGGEQLGVATASTGFSWLLERYLRADLPGFRESFLLDGEGRVLVRSSEAAELAPNAEAWDAVHGGAPYPRAAVLRAIEGHGAGHLEVDDLIVVFQALRVPGWRLVVEAERPAAR